MVSASLFGAKAEAQLPANADVVAGQATISQSVNVLNVNAASNRSIINWDSFNIGQSNVANFNLPSASSAILNRVTGNNMPSSIAGALNSNGHLYLVNPAGIMVTASGMVNTNGFTASAFDVGNREFLAGGPLAFRPNGTTGAIVNEGTITAGVGGAHLIASEIANHGSITAVGGNITMSGGGEVTLSNGVTYVQPTLATLESGISPTAGLIQNTGTIRATGAATSGGEVYLVNPNGNILHDGTIAATKHQPQGVSSGYSAATTGGHVQLEADDITLTENASIDVTGINGGGTALVGGDWQGSGSMAQATSVTMKAGASIDASATVAGDGGTIVLWSDITNSDSITRAFGTLLAKSGDLFGDGGQIETSGANLDTSGISVEASAANGSGGLWLIDPFNYIIDAVAASNIVSTLNSGTSVTVTTTANNASQGSSGNSSDLGDITVASAINKSSGGDAALTLQAANSIIVNADIGSTVGELDVTLDADNNLGVGDGGGIVILGADVDTNGGDLRFGTDRTATIGGLTTKVGGDVYVSDAATLASNGGNVEVSGETIIAATGGLTVNSGGGDVTFDGVLNSGNSYSFHDGPDGSGSWDQAVIDARNGTAGGGAEGDSYLVAIQSRLENSIASSVTIDNGEYRGAWIGIYRDRFNTHGGGNNIWRYAGGPNANEAFFSQDGNSTNDGYNNFGSGEPNGTGTGGEYAGQFFGNQALWNDLSGTTNYSGDMSSVYNVMGYVRETNLAASPLTVNAGSGDVVFGGGVGGSKALSSLNVTANSTTVNGDSLITTGLQSYSSGLNVTSTIGLNVDATTLTTGGALGFIAAGDVSLDANLASSGNVSISGNELLLGGNYSINAGSNDVTLTTDDVTGGVLTLDTTGHFTYAPKSNAWSSSGIGGQLDYTGTIASDTFTGSSDVGWLTINDYSTLGGLTLGKDGNTSSIYIYQPIDVAGSVSLIGNNITIDDDIDTSSVVGADILLKAIDTWTVDSSGVELNAGSGDITVRADTFSWGTKDPTFRTTGNAAILPATDGSSFTHSTVRTSWFIFDPSLGGFQLGHDANTSDITLDTAVTINGPVGIYGGNLNINQQLTTTSGGVLMDAAGNINLGVDITSAGTQRYNGSTLLTDNQTLTTTNSDITFDGTVNSSGGARSLTTATGTGATIFNGDVGGSSVLSSLSVSGVSNVNADITTTGAQIFGDTITLGGSGTRTLSASSLTTEAIVGGATDFDLLADSLTLNGDISGTGDLLIGPKTSGTTVGVGNGSGAFTFDAAKLARIQDGFSSVTIGGATAGDLQVGGLTAINDDLTLQAGSTSDLIVSDAIAFAEDNTLTLAAGNDIFVNHNINVSGSGAGLNLLYGGTDGSSAPSASNNYYLNVADRRSITFDNTSASLKIGNVDFTLIDSVSSLEGMAAGGNYAIADGFSLAGTTYTDGLYSANFSGRLEGLGHELDGLKINAATGGNYGLFSQTNGASIRHLGLTNIDILGQSTSNNAADDLRIGGFIGNSSGSGTTLLDGVWVTGVIATQQGSQQDVFYAGGLVGGHDSGTLRIERSYSTANVSSQGSSSQKMAIGGLLGDSGDSNGVSGIGGSNQNLLIDRSYAVGSIVEGTYAGYYGSGGLVGVVYGNSATITDSFSHSNVVGGVSSGGIAGYSLPATAKTYQRLYTTLDRFGNSTSPTNSYKGDTLDAATNNGTQLPSGWSSSIWNVGALPNLIDVGVPAQILYVQITGGSGVYGDLATPTYQIVDGDGVAVAFGSGVYSDLGAATGTGRYTLGQFTNAGSYSNVSYLSGLSLTGDDANLYALNPFTTSGSYTITPRSITAVLGSAGATKVYDGTTNGPGAWTPSFTFTNIVDGDSASLNIGSSVFNTSQVLTVDTLTLSGLSLAGISGSNGSLIGDYTLSSTTASVAATITPKPLVVTGIFAEDKIYDGLTNASINTGSASLSGSIIGDNVSVTSATGAFANKNVGSNLAVTLSDLGLTGTDASNYSFTPPSGLTADITPKSIIVSGITANNKVYDGTTSATVDLSGINFGGIVSGDNLTASSTTGLFSDKNVADGKSVALSGTNYGGTDVGNYVFTDQTDTTANITPLSVQAWGISGVSRFYDGTTAADVSYTNLNFIGMIAGDDLTAADTVATFNDKNVGQSKWLNLSGTTYGGADVGNYTIADQTFSTAHVVPKRITVTGITADNKVYDGTTSVSLDTTGLSYDGIIAGDDLTASGMSGLFSDKNVGTAKTITIGGASYGGVDVGNYNITDQTSTTADITARALAISGLTADDRIYDGTTVASITTTGVNFDGLVSGDDLAIDSSTGTFTDKHVGSDKTVTLSTLVTGADVSNYSITQQATATATITPRSLTVSGIAASDKVYDATTDVILDSSGVVLGGLVGGDDVTFDSLTGAFVDKNVGSGKTVNLSSTYTGSDASNYAITDQATTTADITPYALTISGIAGDNKVYDGTTAGTVSGTATVGSFAGDDITVENNAIVSFADKNVGDAKSLTINGFSLSGDDAGNYSLSQPTALTANITPATLNIFANNDAKFVTQSDVAGFAGASFDGFVAGDDVSDLAGALSITRAIAGESAGIYSNALTASGLTSTNYDINFVSGDYTIVPAEELLVRFDDTQSTYGNPLGLNFISAQYMDSGNTVYTLTPTGIVGNQYTFDDGVGGTAQFDLELIGSSLSSSGHINVGSFDLGISNLIESSANFNNAVNVVGNHTVNQAPITVSTAGVSKTYDGTVAMNNIVLGRSGDVTGDVVTLSGQGSYAVRDAGTGIAYEVGNLELGGADAGNYFLSGGATFDGTNGIITPKAVTIAAPGVTKVYDGNAGFAVTTAQLQAFTAALGVTGDKVDSITLTYDDKNVGTSKALTPSDIRISDGNAGGNYTITFASDASSTITRLGSVRWIGGTTGDWSDPANWAGGAIPDLANVANIVIPVGVTPIFGPEVAGPVEIDTLSGGSLAVTGGSLDISGTTTLASLAQAGGVLQTNMLNVDDFSQTDGSTSVLVDLNISNSVIQETTGALTVAGIANVKSVGNVQLSGQNDFQSAVNITGNSVTLNDALGGIQLGNVVTTGTLSITTSGGPISQASLGGVVAGGETTFVSDENVSLNSGANSFAGPVNATGRDVLIQQMIGDLMLATVDASGDLQVQVFDGELLQTTSGMISVKGESMLGSNRGINLANNANQFDEEITVNAPVFSILADRAVEVLETGLALADEVGARTSAQLTNDTFVRPAKVSAEQRNATSESGSGDSPWYRRFTDFVKRISSGNWPVATDDHAFDLQFQQDEDEMFLRRKVGSTAN